MSQESGQARRRWKAVAGHVLSAAPTAGGTATEFTGKTPHQFHNGERAVQERVGSVTEANLVERDVNKLAGRIPPDKRRMVNDARVLFCGTIDAEGNPWASIAYAGDTGDAERPLIEDDRGHNRCRLNLDLTEKTGFVDPQMVANLRREGQEPGGEGAPFSVFIVDYDRRLRLHMRGRAVLGDSEARAKNGSKLSDALTKALAGLELEMEDTVPHCAAYVPRLNLTEPATAKARASPTVITSASLDAAQTTKVHEHFSFFHASSTPDSRLVTMSHKGGRPGFVHVLDGGKTIAWPDYTGNGAYHSMGNYEVYPPIALLFPFGKGGTVLQVLGRSELRFDEGRCCDGADREIRVHVEKVIETRGVQPDYELLEISNFSPPTFEGGEATDAAVKDFYASKKFVTLKRFKKRTEDVMTFTLESQGKFNLPYTPGQYVKLLLPGDRTRAFTISNAPAFLPGGAYVPNPDGSAGDGKRSAYAVAMQGQGDVDPNHKGRSNLWHISVKREKNGFGGSKWLHDEVDETDRTEVELLGVEGDFVLDVLNKPMPPKLLLLSAGIGLTPFVAMVNGLDRATSRGAIPEGFPATDMLMLHSTRGAMPFHADLKKTEQKSEGWRTGSRFRLLVTNTGEKDPNIQAPPVDFQGRINREMLTSVVPDLMEREIKVCGPDGFMEQIYNDLEKLGVPLKQIDSERFDL